MSGVFLETHGIYLSIHYDHTYGQKDSSMALEPSCLNQQALLNEIHTLPGK